MHVMASDEDGFQLVKRSRHSAASRAPRKATASLELPITTSQTADDILARVEDYKYVPDVIIFHHKYCILS